jgi:hypothetical protein
MISNGAAERITGHLPGYAASPCNAVPVRKASGLLLRDRQQRHLEERLGTPRRRTMNTRHGTKRTKRSAPRRLVTTLGELISAAYEVAPGMGAQRLERALTLLTRSPLARHINPHVEFVR